jgi:hypothetical protein
MKNTQTNKPAKAIEAHLDKRWVDNTIYNHYENPIDFMNDIINTPTTDSEAIDLITEGKEKYKDIQTKNGSYSTLYADVAREVKDKLHSRGFTTKMLYGDVSFTSQNTGVLSKQRVMLGKRDCYFQNTAMDDSKLFHDIYINLSYSWSIDDKVIENNAYALYALCKELARLVSIRVFVINHVGTDTPTCYSYCLKKFRQPIKPEEFLFFTADSKRTFGWASYELLNPNNSNSTIGEPTNTVSIADFNLDKTIDTIWEKIQPTVTEG